MKPQEILLAGCAITDDDGRLLLIHRAATNQWELPGGKVELDETNHEAAVREVGEELGVRVRIVRELGRKAFKLDEINHDYTWFEAVIVEGEPEVVETDKHDSLGFFSIFDLGKMMQEDELSPNMVNLYGELQAERIVLAA